MLFRSDAKSGFILDGFPRTVAQAAALDEVMEGRDPLIVIDIDVPEADLVRRLSSRRVCEDCGANADVDDDRSQRGPTRCGRCGGQLKQRSDDSEVVVLERLRVYRRDTQPLIDYYRSRPTFRAIDGAQPPDRVAADLAAAILALGNGGAGSLRNSGAVQ